jgi:hypothetical protein
MTKVRLGITAHRTDGRTESDSYVTPHKLAGGKRKGRSMKRNARGSSIAPSVTLENLQAARDAGGYYCPRLKCVVYNRKGE